MRDIKFRYIFEDIEKGKHILTASIEELETFLDIPKNMSNGWQLIARCQSTGLKDKQGKEIYEGDILEHEYPGVSLLKVVYARGGFSVVGIHLKEPLSELLNPDNSLYRQSEVIGNIYENPGFLEECNNE